MIPDTIVYQDRPGRRVLDLRKDGLDCIPVLGLSDFHMIQPGTDFHVHPEGVEINLCVRGNLAFETAEQTYPFLPGSIFVSTPAQPHRMRHNPKGLLLYRILFRPPKPGRRILGLTARESEWLGRSLTHLPKRLFKSTRRVRTAFETLFAAYDEKTIAAARRTKMKAAALELLVAVVEAARMLPPKAPERFVRLARRMSEHPGEDYRLPTLAKELGLSLSSFSETFKRTTGLPPHAYLVSCRVRRAQELLANRRASLKAISDSLGFASTQHFATTFKGLTGLPPSRFAKRPARKTPKQNLL